MPSSSNDRSFWPAFQKRWAAVLCEQTEGLSAWSEAMARALGRGIIEVPNSAEAHAALGILDARVARLESTRVVAETAAVDAATRAHFVRYGAALLSAPGADVVCLELDYGQVRVLVDGVCQWLQLLKLVPRRVFCFEDFDSQIIGRAVAGQLQVEFKVADGDSLTRSKSLIVSADSRALMAPPLRTVFPSQVLYAFNLHRECGTIAPDVASLAHAELVLPWHGERMSARKIHAIIESISSAPLRDTSGDWLNRLEFYRIRRTLLTAGSSSFTRPSMLPESY